MTKAGARSTAAVVVDAGTVTCTGTVRVCACRACAETWAKRATAQRGPTQLALKDLCLTLCPRVVDVMRAGHADLCSSNASDELRTKLAAAADTTTRLAWRRNMDTSPVSWIRRPLGLFHALSRIDLLDTAINGREPGECDQLGRVLAHSAAAESLTHVRLDASSCQAKAMRAFCKHMGQLQRLTSLTLAGGRRNAFDASVVSELGACQSLTTLTLRHAVHPSSSLEHAAALVGQLQQLTQLTRLEFVDHHRDVIWHKFPGVQQRRVADAVLDAMLPLGPDTYFYLSTSSQTTLENYRGYDAAVTAWRRDSGGGRQLDNDTVSTPPFATRSGLAGALDAVKSGFQKALSHALSALWVCGCDPTALEARYDEVLQDLETSLQEEIGSRRGVTPERSVHQSVDSLRTATALSAVASVAGQVLKLVRGAHTNDTTSASWAVHRHLLEGAEGALTRLSGPVATARALGGHRKLQHHPIDSDTDMQPRHMYSAAATGVVEQASTAGFSGHSEITSLPITGSLVQDTSMASVALRQHGPSRASAGFRVNVVASDRAFNLQADTAPKALRSFKGSATSTRSTLPGASFKVARESCVVQGGVLTFRLLGIPVSRSSCCCCCC